MGEPNIEVPEPTRKNLAKRTHLVSDQRFQESERKLHESERRSSIDRLTGMEGEYPLHDMINGLQSRYKADYQRGDFLQGTFIIIDMDDLHKMNHDYGERAGGDDYIRSVAAVLKEEARDVGRCFRKSGADDFVFYLPGFKVRSEIEAKIDNIDIKLAQEQDKLQIKYPGIRFGLSYSVASFHRGYPPIDAYHDAYNAMGQVKEPKDGERVGNTGRLFINELTLQDRIYE